ncbi:unnamed protein product, partial [Mesorhabditis belari]|uniref:Tudor domain-containing protein n=1 Tax=Mesorhabditis belari TaxID=2138241 RepID=A0AAF3EZ50_9BILA
MDVLNWNPSTSFHNWQGKGFGSRGNVKLSACQDLVIVPGGPDWVIRELDEKFPECCWKFAATSSIAQYHFAQAVKPNERLFFPNLAPSKRSTPSIPVFFATLPHFYSPTDFSVQPKYLDEFRNRICEEMEDEYREKRMPKMDYDHLVIGVACATFDGQRWVRTRVLKHSGPENVFVEFVDFGTTKIVAISDLYRLKKRFGKVPPMALRCRIQDVYVNDLDAHKVDAFQKMIVDCGNIVRVELAALDEPYVVNLYHPTIIGINLATSFYRTDTMAAKQLYKPVIDDTPNDEDDDYTDDESSEIDGDEQEIAQVKVIRSLPKAPKIFRAALQTLIIANLENAGCVFLHESNQIDRRIRMEAKMKKMFLEKSLHVLPSEWISLSTACVFVEERNEDLQIHRATIESVEANYVELFFCDLGFWKRLAHEATRKQLYALSEEFSDEPMVYVVSLTDRGRYPHPDLTAQLKQLTSHSTKVKFEREQESKHMPIRGILSNDLHNDLLREAEERLESKRINVKTWALLPYNQSPLHNIISRFINLSFIHQPHPPHSFCRGSLSFETLPMNE